MKPARLVVRGKGAAPAAGGVLPLKLPEMRLAAFIFYKEISLNNSAMAQNSNE